MDKQKEEIKQYINDNLIYEEKLKEAQTEFESIKENILIENKNRADLISKIINDRQNLDNIKDQISKTNADLKLVKEEYNLYSNDLGGISKGSKKIALEYTLYIAITVFLIGLIIWYYLDSTKSLTSVVGIIMNYFSENRAYSFAYLLIYKTSFLAVSLFIVVVLLKFLKGFVSVVIKNNKTLESIRMIDFLLSRLDSQKTLEPYSANEIEFNNKILTSKIEILSKYIPDLIRHEDVFEKIKIDTQTSVLSLEKSKKV